MSATNRISGAEAMVRMLQAYDVRHVFGLCGDTSLPFYDALYRLDHAIEHVQTRDERSAAYMADGYARVTNRVGVCEGPSGGGATYIAPGLVEAGESSIPILAITSDVAVTSRGRYPLTELDQQSLFRPLTKMNMVIPQAAMLPRLVRQAFRAMTTGRPGSAHLGLPIDVQRAHLDPDEIWAEPAHGQFPAWPTAPAKPSVDAALDAILGARRPVIVCGGGIVIAGGEEALIRFAECLQIPVATTVSGQGAITETHALAVGVVGSNGGVPATRAVVDAADLVIFVGCRAGSVTSERWQSPKPGTPIVHIDSDPLAIGANYRDTVAVVGDAALALAAMNEALGGRRQSADFGGAGQAAAARAEKRAVFDRLAVCEETPIRPERLIAALRRQLDDDAIIVADPGTPCPYVSAYFEIRTIGRSFISNRAHGALGYAMAAALGASYGRPDRKVVALIGDGSFGFTAGELETVARCRRPVTFIVVSNAAYGWIKAGQKSQFGERYFSVDFSRTDHAAVASAFGVRAWRIQDPERLDSMLGEAIAHDGPSLVDVICQPLHEANAPVSEWIA